MLTKNEILSLNIDALKKETENLKKNLFELRLAKVTGQLKDTSQFKKLRRHTALILTVISNKTKSQT